MNWIDILKALAGLALVTGIMRGCFVMGYAKGRMDEITEGDKRSVRDLLGGFGRENSRK